MENLYSIIKYEHLVDFDGQNGIERRKAYSFKIQPTDTSYAYTLPDWLNKYVINALYVLPVYTLATIEHLFSEAIKYSKEPLFRGYDTSVRDSLREISTTIIQKAIYLLTDYYYDPNTLYYVSPSDSFIYRNTLSKLVLYQMWSGRTGRGLQRVYSKMEYDEYYNGATYYQNDFWLKKLLENQEQLQEEVILKNQNIIIDEENTYDIEHVDSPNEITCSRYDVTFIYYRHKEIIDDDDDDISLSFEDSFANDIPDRSKIKYKVAHYNVSAALRLAFNRFAQDTFEHFHRLDIHPIYDLKYSIDLIKKNTGIDDPMIDVLKT